MAQQLNTQAIADLNTWVHAPTTLKDLNDILDRLELWDLISVTLYEDKNIARIAWAELGQRRGLMDMHLNAVEVKGVLHLQYRGDAFPLSHGVKVGG